MRREEGDRSNYKRPNALRAPQRRPPNLQGTLRHRGRGACTPLVCCSGRAMHIALQSIKLIIVNVVQLFFYIEEEQGKASSALGKCRAKPEACSCRARPGYSSAPSDPQGRNRHDRPGRRR